MRSSRPMALWWFVWMLVLLPARTARATTVVPVTLEDLSRRADAVLMVVPRAAQSQWVGGRIDTDYDLEVLSVVRGNVAEHTHVVLRLPGGVVGNIGQMVPDVPSLAIGATYAVFVSRARTDASLFYLAHLTAAVLAVNVSADGTATVAAAVHGMVTGGSGTAMRATGLPMDAFIAAVQGAR